jgi:hypothetical protein
VLDATLKALYAIINAHQNGGSCSLAGVARRPRGPRRGPGRRAEPDTTAGDLTGFSADGAVYHLKAGAAEAWVSQLW